MKSRIVSSVARAASTISKEAGDISSVFPSLSGKTPDALPARYSDLKKGLLRGKEDVVTASWYRLLSSLRREIDEVKAKGTSVIPSVDLADVVSGNVSGSVLDSIRYRGTAVLRNVLPRQQAQDLKAQAQEYIAANKPKVKAFPADDPAVYELYWSPSQVSARGHPNVLKAQTFLATLWHSSNPQSEISTRYPLSYADRFRIRRPGDAKFALGPHTDGGSLERWEDPEYARVYQPIFNGNWEQYDPWDARHRISANMDLYNGGGACSAFRLFQGWLAMSTTAPGEGTLRVCPLLKHATAYTILRPFFDVHSNKLNMDTSFPNSVQAAAQEYSYTTHPGLQLEETMVSVPRVEPGDFVAWHCDQIHAVDKEHHGQRDSSVMYIPACAMTPSNVEFVKRQRMAALAYSPPPDFPGAGGPGEIGFEGAVDWSGLGEDGMRAIGLGRKRWDVTDDMSEGEKRVVEMGNRVLFG